MEEVGTLIIGAGIAGSSLAMHLADLGEEDVVVVDPDLAGVRSSSELNAGGVRATWWREVNIEMCAHSIEYYGQHAEEFGFREKGYLWLYGPELWKGATQHAQTQNALGWPVELLTADEVVARWPVIDNKEGIAGATFSPRDGLISPHAVKEHYRSRARAGGVEFRDRRLAVGMDRDDDAITQVRLCHIEDGLAAYRSLEGSPEDGPREALRPLRVVNAAGPWAAKIARLMGGPVHSRAVRRQISVFASQDLDLSGQGMIVDTTGVYFHHESGNLLLGGYSPPGDPPSYDFTYDGAAFFESEIWPRLAARMSVMDRLHHVHGWAGLYALTPDNSAILGGVEGVRNAFEIHSFSGRGIMQSYAAGLALAELITTGRHQTFRRAERLDARRFARGHEEPEDLHI
ncbi:MAG: FAD-binding oxidoreductase [Thermoleophilia bacterium]|nr:FAD-binding oxidoreductase [Thermoleophilia bacterium]